MVCRLFSRRHFFALFLFQISLLFIFIYLKKHLHINIFPFLHHQQRKSRLWKGLKKIESMVSLVEIFSIFLISFLLISNYSKWLFVWKQPLQKCGLSHSKTTKNILHIISVPYPVNPIVHTHKIRYKIM